MRTRLDHTFARLLALLTLVCLLTSRIMLLLHEFGGHGATATLLGGHITDWNLFLFAGGRVAYAYPDRGIAIAGRVLVSMGGIGLEVVLGALAFVVARRRRARPALRFSLFAVGTVLLGHGTLYLARGVHYGFGDGALVAWLLGAQRWPIVGAASALAIATGFHGGRRLARLAVPSLGRGGWAAIQLMIVFLCAGAIHGGLALAEVTFFPDTRWAAIMEDASLVRARADLARRVAEAEQRGEALNEAERRRILEATERARRPFPLDPWLAASVLLALGAGVIRGVRSVERSAPGRPDGTDAPDAPDARPEWRTVGLLFCGLAVALGAILVLRLLRPAH